MAENQQVINLGSVQSPYLEQRLTIPAGGTKKFNYTYNSFNLLYASVPDVLEVTFGGAAVQSKFASGMSFGLQEPVSYIQFFNNSNQPVDIWFALAIGEIKDNRLNVSGTVLIEPENGAVFMVEPENNSVFMIKQKGFTNYQAGTKTGASSLTYKANSQIDILCTSGTITVNNSAGVSSLVLSAGQSWSACLATAGTLAITGTGGYNYSVGDWG